MLAVFSTAQPRSIRCFHNNVVGLLDRIERHAQKTPVFTHRKAKTEITRIINEDIYKPTFTLCVNTSEKLFKIQPSDGVTEALFSTTEKWQHSVAVGSRKKIVE